jgi:sigma-B regulation protein RsbU (phosphoserine phosphatase)
MTDKKLRILVVDDDSVDREAVRRLLAGADVSVEEAEDAASGMAAMREGRADAIVLDYSLPGKDGAVVLREAVAAGVKAPILVLTGHGDEQLVVELMRAGAADYLPKSALTLKGVDLLQRLRQMLKLHKAEEEARAGAVALQERVEFEQQLIGVVSHDLRNPLSTIRLSAQVLRARSKDESQRGVIERIIRATSQADRMIRDLLDFTQARLGAGIPVDLAPGDFHATVRQVLADLGAADPERQVLLEQTGPGAGVWDAARLSQLAMNLVGNAYQHSPAGTPIQVVSSVENGMATLRVSNAGPAIPAEQLPRLFEPLRRGRSVSSSKTGSIGLGLFISQEIARAHGGTIEVTSTEKGTTFSARLPVGPQAPAAPPHG